MKSSFPLLTLLVWFLGSSNAIGQDSYYVTWPANGHTYEFRATNVGHNVSWEDALAQANDPDLMLPQLAEDHSATLVSINSAAEEEFIHEQLENAALHHFCWVNCDPQYLMMNGFFTTWIGTTSRTPSIRRISSA